MPGTFTVSGLSSSEPSGSSIVGPITYVGNVVVGEKLAVPLASGDNTYTVPSGSGACLIVAPSNTTATIKYRTSLNGGDIGLPISGLGQPFLHVFPSPAPTSLILIPALACPRR